MNILSQNYEGFVEIYHKAVIKRDELVASFSFLQGNKDLSLYEFSRNDFCDILVQGNLGTNKVSGVELYFDFAISLKEDDDAVSVILTLDDSKLEFGLIELLTQLSPAHALQYLKKIEAIKKE